MSKPAGLSRRDVILASLTPQQRAFYESPVPKLVAYVGRRSGESHFRSVMREINQITHGSESTPIGPRRRDPDRTR